MTTALQFNNPDFIKNEVRKERLRRKLLGCLVEFTAYFFECRGEMFIKNHHHYRLAESLE